MTLLFVTGNSATFELENTDIFFTKEYEICLNGEFHSKSDRNVFTLYDLKPNFQYEIQANGEKLNFTTLDKKFVILKSNKNSQSETDGQNDTELIQTALYKLTPCETLVLQGIFYTSSLFVKSDSSVYLPSGTTVYGLLERTEYKILKSDETLNGKPLGTWEGRADDSFASIFTFLGAENSFIYGQGTVDYRSGETDWWINHRVMRIARRPKGIFIHSSKKITIEGITVKNTPSWNQHAFYSQDIKYLKMRLENPWNSPTTDGCDPESCDNVQIIGNEISVGDDCIALKSSKIELARIYRTPCQNVTIRNNLMMNGHGGITVGSEISGGIKNISAERNIFRNTDRGLRIKTQRGRGNTPVSDITFKNIRMESVKSPFVINAFYKAGNDILDERFDEAFAEPTELTPVLGNFLFQDIICENVAYGIGYFKGLPESQIQKITLKNIKVTFDRNCEPGEMAMCAVNEKFKNHDFYLKNVKEFVKENVEIE